jgi:hypothetical protein
MYDRGGEGRAEAHRRKVRFEAYNRKENEGLRAVYE